MGVITDSIKDKLTLSFNPSQLEVIDESYKHAGHAGAAAHAQKHGAGEVESGGSAESHFVVKISAEAFEGQSRLARHRAVMDALGELMKDRVHALSVEFV